MADFQTTTNQMNNITTISIGGFLDAHTAPKLEEAFVEQINSARYKIVVDFEQLKYISSAGLGVFMAFIETMRNNGGDIKLAAMQPNVFNIFDLLGFPFLYEIFPSAAEAVAKFREPNEAAS
jgi:anti-sigma B factor antagonist